MRVLNSLFLSAMLAFSGVCLSAHGAENSTPAAPVAVKSEKSTVKQLRGKLLYRRNQIRKLERAAMAANEELGNKVRELEQNRRDALAAGEPKLKELYALEKELQGQIDSMTAK